MNIVPSARPQMTRSSALALAHEMGVEITKPFLLGRRGYWRDTMGLPGKNDFGLYDDAIMLVSPAAYVTFNANCDPTRHHPGVAQLCVGVWRYKVGVHGLSRPAAQRYEALVQAAPVTVLRDPDAAHAAPWKDTGWFGINIHRGSLASTSSEGCQTIYPTQYDAFLALVKNELARFSAIELPYALTDRGTAAQ